MTEVEKHSQALILTLFRKLKKFEFKKNVTVLFTSPLMTYGTSEPKPCSVKACLIDVISNKMHPRDQMSDWKQVSRRSKCLTRAN